MTKANSDQVVSLADAVRHFIHDGAHISFRELMAIVAAPLDPPTAEELRILRQEVDPQRLILG